MEIRPGIGGVPKTPRGLDSPSWYRPLESIDPSGGGIPRKVRAFDTQLAKLLGDPRKPKTGPFPRGGLGKRWVG